MDANKFKKIKSYGKVSVVENYANQYAVTDCNGEIIVPYGKYGWIDGFDSGLARVRTPKDPGIANNVTSIIIDLFGDDTKVISGKEDIRNYYTKDKRENPDKYAKWGIINEKGEEVLPVIYDEVWSFYGKNRYSTKVVKDGIESDIYFHDLNPDYCYMARKADPDILKRKVVKGGSWKDISYFMQCGVRTYEYQYESRPYIGFRCVRSYIGE